MAEESRTLPLLRRRLLAWFDRHCRDLPWRRDRDPYRIWVSEVMLQQTTVATVKARFDAFLTAFPDLPALAAADEQAVLRAWEGLGYYRRARNLHATARQLVADHGGELPDDPQVWAGLPGVGRYMVGAILSQAFDRRLPIVEANSLRVMCRLFGREGDTTRGPIRRWLWEIAERLLPRRRAGDFNQALMELGALVCTPSKPRCPRCPVAAHCVAFREGRQDRLPTKSKRPMTVDVREVAVVVRRGERVFLVRRPEAGRWSNMWEFPHGEIPGDESAETAARRMADELLGFRVAIGDELMTIRHGVTHHRITMTCWDATFVAGTFRPSFYVEGQWLMPEELARFPVSSRASAAIVLSVQFLRYLLSPRVIAMLPRVLLFMVAVSLALAGCNDAKPTGTVGLDVGNIAPPLAGADIDGKSLSLADYKGKVVVVDFWATWCPPCRAMIPHEKELVKRLEGRPFAFLGVSADNSKGDLASFLQNDPLPWPNIFDGSSGPLGNAWEIRGYPSIFVIDAKGVIRYRDVRGPQLDKAVEKLVAEAEGK